MSEWKRFEDEFPSNTPIEQVDILFGHPDWSTYIRGMYTHYENEPLRERLSEYRQDIDKFYQWDNMMPTHWMKLPTKPTKR